MTPEAVYLDYPTIIVYVNELTPWPRNYNLHPEAQLNELGESLTAFRQFKPVIAWRCEADYTFETGEQLHAGLLYLIGGHGIWQSAMRVGVDRLEAKDISGVSVDIAEAILLADNAASKGSEPDMARLASLLERARQTQVVRDRPRLAAMLERLSGGMGANGDGTPIDPMAEWQGMPEFEQEDNFGAIATVKVHFATPEDIKHFSHLMEQTVNENTTFIWFPKQKPENLKVYRVSYES